MDEVKEESKLLKDEVAYGGDDLNELLASSDKNANAFGFLANIPNLITKNEQLKKAWREAKNFKRDFAVIGYAKVKAKGGRGEKEVNIFGQIHWNQGKYTGEKLREIRHNQLVKMIDGKTEFDDGTPIILNRLVDWSHEVHTKQKEQANV